MVLMVAFAVSMGIQTVRAVAPVNAISYQGRLLNDNGVPVADASLEFVFRLFSASSGGTCLWESDDGTACDATDETQTVALTDGLFSENIGSTDDPSGLSEAYPVTLAGVFEANADVFLEVQVGGEILTPRKRIAAVPFALNAQSLDGLDSTDLLAAAGGTGTGSFDFTGAELLGASPLVFEGATDDGDVAAFSFVDPTADNTITFQDASGTVAYLSDITAGQWETGTNGTYEDDAAVIVGPDVAETLLNAGFVLAGNNDLFVGGMMGVEGAIYTDDAVFAGTTEFTEGAVVAVGTLGLTAVGEILITADQLEPTGATDLGDPSAGWDNIYIDVAGADLSLESSASATSSGAFAIGVFDEFANSAATNAQAVLNDLDVAISDGGAGAMWTRAGNVVYPTDVLNDFAVGGTAAAASPFGVDESANTVFVGEGSNSNGTITFKASDADTGSLAYTTADRWDFTGGDVQVSQNLSTLSNVDMDLAGTETVTLTSVPGAFDVTVDAMSISFAAAHDDTATNLNYGLHVIQASSGLAPEYGADALIYIDNQSPDSTVAGLLVGGAGAFEYGIDLSPMVGGIDFRLSNTETIDNQTDDAILFSGTGGSDNTDLQFDLDGTMPVIDSFTDASVSIGDNLLVGATTVAGTNAAFTLSGDDLYAAGHIAAQFNAYADSFVAGDASTTYADGSVTTTGSTDFLFTIAGGDLSFAQSTVIGDGGDILSVNSSDWDISTVGALSGIQSVASDDNQTTLGTNIGVTGTDAISHTISFGIDGNTALTIAATGDGAGSVGVRTVAIASSSSADIVTIGDANADVSLTDADWTLASAGVLTLSATTNQTTAIVLTDTDYTNALSIGDNSIVGTTAAIDFTEFDVSASTGSITVDDGGDAGQISVEGTILDIDSLTFVGSGTLANTSGDLLLDGGASVVATAVGDALRVQASTAADNSFTDSPAFVIRGAYDSNTGVGPVTQANYDAEIIHNMVSGGASPSSEIVFDIAGGSDEFSIASDGGISGLGGAKLGDGSGSDEFDFEATTTTTDAFLLTADSTTSGDAIQISADALTTGRGIFLERADNGTSFTSTDALLTVSMLDTTSTGRAASFANLGTGSALFVNQDNNTGTTVSTTAGGALHIDNTSNANYGLTVYSNQATSSSPLAYVFADNVGFDSDVARFQMDSTAGADNAAQDQAALRVLVGDIGNPSNNNVNNGGIVIDTTEEDVVNGDNLQQELFQVRMDSDNNGTGVNTVFAIDVDGDFGYDGTAYTTAVDVAEIYDSTDALVAGEIVAVDASATDGVRRSANAYQSTVIGVISTRPGVLLGAGGADGTYTGYPVALAGRVPTYVSDENGSIAVGDPIAASSAAGVGMKATEPGMIVGYALEDYTGTGTGSVSVFVNPGFYAGNVMGTDGIDTLIADDVVLTTERTADVSSPGIGSPSLSLRGSGFDGATGQDIAMSLVTDVSDATDYRLSFENSAGAQVAYVSNEGDLAISGRLYPSDRGSIQTSKYIYYDGSVGMGGDFMRTNAAGWATGSYDFAEMFPSRDVLEAGDLVAFGADNESVRRSGSDRAGLAGIVSTRPGFLAGENLPGQYPIALAGRVPTKVTLENGPIAIGDALTASSTPGAAMKATEPGMIVGYALEPFDGSDADGKVIAFVSVGYWNGVPVPEVPGTDNQASTIVVTQNADNLTSLNMNGDIYMTGNAILGVRRMAGLSDRWSIEEDGTVRTNGIIKTTIESYQGERVDMSAVTSPDVQITLTGTGVLENGEAVIRFEDASPSFNDVTSTIAPIRVIVTPSGPVSLYVYEKNNDGFGVRQIGGASDGIEFDWMVSAYRKDYEPEALTEIDEPIEEETPVVEDPIVEEAVVDEPVAEPTEDPAPPVSPDDSSSDEPASPDDSMESTSVEPAPLVLPSDDVLSTES